MAPPSPAIPVKLFVVTLHSDIFSLESAAQELRERFGEVDFLSEDYAFEQTGYYEPEMGLQLARRFYSFERLIDPCELASIKLFTNSIESRYCSNACRKVNLDPGTVDFYKVVLASAKFGGQKIYLRDGIYADMTLVMNRGKWESFAWGFPDFKSGRYDLVLSRIRDLYKAQMKLVRQQA